MNWLVYLIGSAMVASWILWRYKNRRMIEMASKLPGPETVPLLGNALLFMGQPQEFIKIIKDLMSEYGEVFRFWLGPDLNILVSNPDDIKKLLSNPKTSTKGPQYKYMADVLGGGILSGSGPVWRKHRKIANPNYGKRAIQSYGDVFNQEVDLLLQKFRRMKREQFNVYTHIVWTTSQVVCRTCTLPAGSSIVIPIFHLHRDPRFWNNPESFDPERFNPENTKKRNPNSYIPFSLGPMDCLGRFFAIKLVKTVCVRMLREFEVTSNETYDDLRLIISISVQSLNGFPILLRPRQIIRH